MGKPHGTHQLPCNRSPPGPGGNLRAASPTAPAAVGTRGLPAPASRARFPHVLLAAAQNYKLQWRNLLATTGSLPFVPPPAAQRARPAPSCAHAGRPAGETPTAATTPAAGGRARRRRARGPEAGSVMRSDSRPAAEDLERQEAPELSRPACTPASLVGWFAPPRA